MLHGGGNDASPPPPHPHYRICRKKEAFVGNFRIPNLRLCLEGGTLEGGMGNGNFFQDDFYT